MNRFLFVALIAIVSTALVWGLMTVGGPAFARMEDNDATRRDDLHRLASYYRCERVWRKGKADGISPTYCSQGENPPPDLRDPLTDAPYSFSETEMTFKVCATFEIDAKYRREERAKQIFYEGQEGCRKYYRKGDVWSARVRP